MQGGCEPVTPGFGQSESFYSFTTTAYNIGQICGSLVLGGLLPRLIMYRFSVVVDVIILLTGAVMYGCATEPFMLPMARFFIGIFDGFCLVIISSYIGETTTKIQNERARLNPKEKTHSIKQRQNSIAKIQAQNTLKDKLFTVYLFVRGLGFPLALGKF